MIYRVGAITDCGHVRASNQDRFLVCTGRNKKCRVALLAIADGMGGLAHGERASTLIIQELQQLWNMQLAKGKLTQAEISKELDSVIYNVHRQIYYKSQEEQERAGTTLSVLVLQNREYLYKQIGDSRIYLSTGAKPRQLTVDQTWCNARLQEGVMTREEILHHPMCHALCNALGASEELQIVTGDGSAPRGASFLLCSDGFYNGYPEIVEQERWAGLGVPQKTLNKMMKKILNKEALDNATAVLCRVPYLIK